MLLAIAPNAPKDKVSAYAVTINLWADVFGITSRLRMAHFLAQAAHESAGFRYTRELASGEEYDTGRKAIALGNTPEKDGDGQRYKGRGLLQLTGTANYKAYQESGFCKGDILAKPELLERLPGSVKSAMWFWWKNGLNQLADKDDLTAVTRRINGGMNGIDSRKRYLQRAKRVIPETTLSDVLNPKKTE